MLSNHSLLRLVYWTTKSARTTTPNIVKYDLPHPHLRQQVARKSYKYDVTGDHIKNKQLYYNQAAENKRHADKLQVNRAKKFNIRPLVDKQSLEQRSFEEILKQLQNRRLIQRDPVRITANIFEVLKVYPKQSQQNRASILWAVTELQKQISSSSWKGFSIFCKLCQRINFNPTQNMFVCLYQHLYSAQALKQPIPLDSLAFVTNYIFSVQTPEKIKQRLHKDQTPLKLFEYNDPRPFSFQQLMNKLYTPEYIQEYVSKNGNKNIATIVNRLKHLPGNTIALLNQV